VRAVVEQAAHRIVVAGDVLEYASFFLPDDRIVYDEKAVEKHLRKGSGVSLLGKVRSVLASLEDFSPTALEQTLKDLAQTEGAKLGDVNQAARVATTGKGSGFGTYETLSVLGKERCLARIDHTLTVLTPSAPTDRPA
jgi:glutamyl-tRNA synthetase